jgi:hypothetical protein
LEIVFSMQSIPRLYTYIGAERDCEWESIPCGGGIEYLHRSPASGRRQRKGNPVPGGITRPPSSWEIQIRGSGPTGWGSLEFETVQYAHESRGTRTWEWQRWRAPAAIVYNRPILSWERMLHKDYNRKCSDEK